MNFAYRSAQQEKCKLLLCQKLQSDKGISLHSLATGNGQKFKQNHPIALPRPWVQTDHKLFGEGGNTSINIKEITLTTQLEFAQWAMTRPSYSD